MNMKTILSAVTLAALVAASVSTVTQADAGGRGGDRGGPMFNFEAMDANADGKVTKDEIAAYHTAKIVAMDTDKDGNLSETELLAGQAQREAAREAQRGAKMVERMIERQDANKDGVLSVEEMTPPADRGDKMFARVDTDGDGAISKAEADVLAEKMAKRGEKRGHGKHKRGDRDDG